MPSVNSALTCTGPSSASWPVAAQVRSPGFAEEEKETGQEEIAEPSLLVTYVTGIGCQPTLSPIRYWYVTPVNAPD